MVRPAWTARFSSGAHINLGCKPKTKFKDLIELMVDVDVAVIQDPRAVRVPPQRGRSLTFTQKVPQHTILGLAGRCAGEGLARPAVVPPAGRVREWPRPCRGAGGTEVGRFRRKRRGRCGPRGHVPYREAAARIGREGGGRRVGGPGLQSSRSGCGGVQRVAWNSSRPGVRTARRSKFLSVGSLPMVLTRSRRESGTWPNRVSRTSRIASVVHFADFVFRHSSPPAETSPNLIIAHPAVP